MSIITVGKDMGLGLHKLEILYFNYDGTHAFTNIFHIENDVCSSDLRVKFL